MGNPYLVGNLYQYQNSFQSNSQSNKKNDLNQSNQSRENEINPNQNKLIDSDNSNKSLKPANIVGLGRPANITTNTPMNPDAKEFKSAFGDLSSMSQPGIIRINIPSDIHPSDKHSSDKHCKKNRFEDIFKVLLGIEPAEEEIVSESKLKLKEYDLERDDYEVFDTKIRTIDDLLELSKLYDEFKPDLMDKYTIDLKKLVEMREPLTELKNMIGMESVKKSIIRQVVYFLQGIEEQQDMLHMVITGSPGTGKTSLGMILSKLYYSMGLLDSKPSVNPISGKKEDFVFKIYKRADLVGQYLGHTAIKTQKAIDECLGGVMFLDEAYSLGGPDEKSDIYTKECLDTINQNLSENKKNFILIIAGYPDQLDKCFFSHNEGLKRRFAFRYHIEKYTSTELAEMLSLKIKQNKWKLESNVEKKEIIKMIDESKEMFDNFGGDIESWLLHVKIEHGVRIFGKHPKFRRCINTDDLKKGLEYFKVAKENKHQKEKLEHDKSMMQTLYC